MPRRLLIFYLPFLLFFIVPNVMKLAPWIWDNIKVLFYWYVASIPLVAYFLAHWFKRRSKLRWMAVGLLAILLLSGVVDVVRTITNTVEYPPDTLACMFWLRNRRHQSWNEKPTAAPDAAVDEVALLDAAGERARHAARE